MSWSDLWQVGQHVAARRVNLAGACLLALAVGCGDAGPERFSVAGRVTYDGQPVSQGTIGLTPLTQGGPSSGADIIDGSYAIPAERGPIAGTYQVWIEAQRPSGRKIQADEGSSQMVDELVQYVPAIYNLDSQLQVDIAGDREDLDFTLEKPDRSRRASARR